MPGSPGPALFGSVWSNSCRSPLRDRSVTVTPDRVAPAMSLCRARGDIRLVDFDTESRARRDLDKSGGVVEHRRVDEVVEQLVGGVVVDAKALFLDDGVVAAGVDLDTTGQGDRAERGVQGR